MPGGPTNAKLASNSSLSGKALVFSKYERVGSTMYPGRGDSESNSTGCCGAPRSWPKFSKSVKNSVAGMTIRRLASSSATIGVLLTIESAIETASESAAGEFGGAAKSVFFSTHKMRFPTRWNSSMNDGKTRPPKASMPTPEARTGATMSGWLSWSGPRSK